MEFTMKNPARESGLHAAPSERAGFGFVDFWRLLSVLLVALVVGLAFAHVLERPAKMDYDARLYTTLQQTLYREWGPPNFGGFLEPAAILATLVSAFLVRRNRPVLWLTLVAGALLLLAFPIVFMWIVAPVNHQFLSSAPGQAPPGWADLRVRWELGHAIRFVLQLVALALLVASLQVEQRWPRELR
jgi:hypothetical protein